MWICPGCDPSETFGDGTSPAFCFEHAPRRPKVTPPPRRYSRAWFEAEYGGGG